MLQILNLLHCLLNYWRVLIKLLPVLLMRRKIGFFPCLIFERKIMVGCECSTTWKCKPNLFTLCFLILSFAVLTSLVYSFLIGWLKNGLFFKIKFFSVQNLQESWIYKQARFAVSQITGLSKQSQLNLLCLKIVEPNFPTGKLT